MNLPDIEKLCKIMAANGVTSITLDNLTIVRPLSADPAPRKDAPEPEFERLKRMTLDQQDKALMLRRRVGPEG